MQQFYVVKEVFNERLKRRCEFSVSNDYLEGKVTEKLQEVAASARIDGFRKGKVSPEFLRRVCGKDVVKEVLANVVDSASSKFLSDGGYGEKLVTSDVRITSYPKVCSDDGKGGDLVYELEFEVMPEVPAIDFDSISLKEIEVQVSEEDIKEFLEKLEEDYPEFEAVSDEGRCAALNDKVTIDYRVSIKGKTIKGGSANGARCILGKNVFLKDFESNIVGLKKGEEKNFKMKFPDDYPAAGIAGKDVEVFVKLNALEVMKESGGREELAKKCGFETVDDMVKFATDRLNERFADMGMAVMEKELLEVLDKQYSLEVPVFLVSQEIGRMSKEVREDGSGEDTVRKEAERRVKLGILLMQVAGDAKITVESQDILSFIRYNYPSYGQSMDAVLKLFKSRGDFRDHVKGKVLEDKVVRHMISKAQKEKQVMSAGELKGLLAGA